MADHQDDLTEEERTLFGGYDLAAQMAVACARLRTFDTPAGRDPLGYIVNALMTEFWDQGFSQSDIRAAFDAALAVRASGDFPLLWFGLYEAPEPIDLPARTTGRSRGKRARASASTARWQAISAGSRSGAFRPAAMYG